MNFRPHVTQNVNRWQRGRRPHHTAPELSSEPEETTLIERAFGWMKTNRWYPQNQTPGTGKGSLAVSDDRRGVQSLAASEDTSRRSVGGAPKAAFFNTNQPPRQAFVKKT